MWVHSQLMPFITQGCVPFVHRFCERFSHSTCPIKCIVVWNIWALVIPALVSISFAISLAVVPPLALHLGDIIVACIFFLFVYLLSQYQALSARGVPILSSVDGCARSLRQDLSRVPCRGNGGITPYRKALGVSHALLTRVVRCIFLDYGDFTWYLFCYPLCCRLCVVHLFFWLYLDLGWYSAFGSLKERHICFSPASSLVSPSNSL